MSHNVPCSWAVLSAGLSSILIQNLVAGSSDEAGPESASVITCFNYSL